MWDPYPQVHVQILESIKKFTNIPFDPKRNVVHLKDPALFETPFLIIKGNAEFKISEFEKKQLKKFITRGGLVLFDDTLADREGEFGRSIRLLLAELYPDQTLRPIPQDHALFRSFFLLRNIAGRRISQRYLEGLEVGGSAGTSAALRSGAR